MLGQRFDRPDPKQFKQKRGNLPEPAEGQVRVRPGVAKLRPQIAEVIKMLSGEEKRDTVTVLAAGPAIGDAVSLAEVVKRRVANVSQTVELGTVKVVDTYVPVEEGKEEQTREREMASMTIVLSTKALDAKHVGYQAPLPAAEVDVNGSIDEAVRPPKARKPKAEKKDEKKKEGGEKKGKKGEKKDADKKEKHVDPTAEAEPKKAKKPRRGKKAAEGEKKEEAEKKEEGEKKPRAKRAKKEKPAKEGEAKPAKEEKKGAKEGEKKEKPKKDEKKPAEKKDGEKKEGDKAEKPKPKRDRKPKAKAEGEAKKAE